ncbi:hypothetical protein CRUP_021612 [Coryphaenoides rupestris]|nr:hypothetical protein CRUP_021612 [Coryphaenoides rupestris]
MCAWVVDRYGTNEVLRVSDDVRTPTIRLASEVLIQVEAASLNPLDISMRGGYGANLLRLRRGGPLSVLQSDSEFPLILGRDVSGVVVECGSQVTHFAPGDEGSLAEYVTLTEYEVSHKPKSLSHTEAASVPYVAATALSALVNAAGLCRDNCSDKRQVLSLLPWFDVVLDNVGGGDTERWAAGLLRPWSGAKYVTLVTPLLHNMDSAGVLDGVARSGCSLHNKAMEVNADTYKPRGENRTWAVLHGAGSRRHYSCSVCMCK